MLVAAGFASGQTAFLPNPVVKVSTVPANGDVNPYGVAFVESSFRTGIGPLKAGDVLVSNFNNSANLQGTGTTIVRIPAGGTKSTLFYQGPAGLGLTTALGTLSTGFIVVGNGPTVDGTSATAKPGSLLVIDNTGKLVQTFTSPDIQYPWDMALVDRGNTAMAFVSNALTGTVLRISFNVNPTGLTMTGSTVIASGYVNRGDPAALFVAPTGLVYNGLQDVLYVASSGDNAVYAVSQARERTTSAGLGTLVYADNTHLHGALAMSPAPNGHLLVTNNDVVNADPAHSSEVVEFTTTGQFVKQLSMDKNPGGSFGLAVDTVNNVSTFASVDDNTSSITIWKLNQ